MAAPNESIVEPSGPKFARADRAESVRVPDFMRGWWTELGVNSVEANLPHVIWRVRGPQGASRFRAALRNVATRHDVLTSKVMQRDGAFYLERIAEYEIAERSVADVDSAAAVEPGAPLRDLVASLVWTPFAQDAPVFRPFIVEVSADDAVCGFVLHHRVTDYFGCQILARQIREHMLGEAAEQAGYGPGVQYSDYLRGMADWVTSAAANRRLEYWRESMRDAPPTCLPANAEATVVGSLHYPLQYVEFTLSPDLRTRLAAAARYCRSTMAMILMATNHLALAATLRQSDVATNVVVAGRDTPALLDMAGYAADCFPMRASLTPEVPLPAFIRHLQDTFARACRYRVKFEQVEQAMREVRASPIMPLFNYLTETEEPMASGTMAVHGEPGISLERIHADMPTHLGLGCINLSHVFNMLDTGRIIYANVRYMAVRYDRRTIVTFVKRYLRCATAIARDPRVLVGRIMES